MLAQNFKSAADLGITEPQLSALQKTLVLLETGKLKHVPESAVSVIFKAPPKLTRHFNMAYSFGVSDCGSVSCIRGTAMLAGHVDFEIYDIPDALHNLFYSGFALARDPDTAQAATALRSYLTTGDARWDLAVS